ncbi:MAG: GNAT family N-acetyltransferase [Candidatus Hydrogenedentes bacterium]|nr:GNAT family N-acetyltransferase [Candidatus Hydrogenedentota bacterium]
MDVRFYNDLATFDAIVRPFLLRNEAENNVMLGVLRRRLAALRNGVQLDVEPPLLCIIANGGDVVGAAIQTPPYGLNLTQLCPDASDALVEALSSRSVMLNGVHGPSELAASFASVWTTRHGLTITLHKPLFLYKLNTLLPFALPPGTAELATPKEADLLLAWELALDEELGLIVRIDKTDLLDKVAAGTIFVWRTDVAVATAGFRAASDTAARVVGVYVPPEHRRSGYATALVGAISEHLLQRGYRDIFLFTDAEDVGPNIVYTRLGYERMGEFTDFRFSTRR